MKIFGTDYAYLSGRMMEPTSGMDDIYFRSDNALINSGKTLYLSSWMHQISFMPHLVVRIGRVGKGIDPVFADRYYSEVAMGLSLADRDYLIDRRTSGLDPMLSYSFDGALMVGQMYPKGEIDPSQMLVRIIEEGDVKKKISTRMEMPSKYRITEVISMLSHHFLLKMGDLITFPLWQEYVSLNPGQHIHLSSGDEEVLFMGLK